MKARKILKALDRAMWNNKWHKLFEITVKPILHRICDMDNMTAKELIRLRGWSESFVDEINFIRVERDQACFYKGCSLRAEVFFNNLSPSQFECLLGGNSHGKFFDLFGLIDSGFAIDFKNTI